jgi:hypothetical protein
MILSKDGQTWSNVVKDGQKWSDVVKDGQFQISGHFWREYRKIQVWKSEAC